MRSAHGGVASRHMGILLAAMASAVLFGCSTTNAADDADESPVRFVDAFDGGELDATSWNTCHWWNDGGCTISSSEEVQWYLPEQVSVADGALRLTAIEEPVVGDGEVHPYRSGMVTTGPSSDCGPAKVAITYGTVEVRARVPGGSGMWPALWMLPADCESRPEIDILEVAGVDPTTAILHLHPADRSAASLGTRHTIPVGSLDDGWHDFALTWRPSELVWSVDGVEVWRVVGSEVPNEPMYLVANLAVGGAYGGDVDPNLAFPVSMEIDSVRMSSWESE